MNYCVNPSAFSSVFTLPCDIVDKHLKLAKAEHLKVLLYIFRNMSEPILKQSISNNLNISEYDVEEALLYWADAGILIPPEKPIAVSKTKAITKQDIKPTRCDVAKRGMEDPKISFLLREAQVKMGRGLKSNESSILVWLYDDLGLDVSLILLIIQYAVQHKKCNIRFIETVATNWIDKGVDNIVDADVELQKMAMGEQAWSIVSSCFGIERRKPSQKETDHSVKWLNEWKISKELLVAAYEECVNLKSKFSFAYTAKIIENWHEKGITSPEETEKVDKPDNKNNIAAYDLDLYEKMLNSKD